MSIVKGLTLLILFLITILRTEKIQRKLVEEREYFINTLNHDLKVATLAQIRGLEILEKISLENQKDLIKDINNSCKYSLEMLSMLANSYKFDNGKKVLTYNKLNLNTLITNCIQEISNSSIDKNIKTVFSPNSYFQIFADEDALKKIIKILILTSYSYANSNSIVEIKIRKKMISYKISINYTGNPLSEQECTQMFSKKNEYTTVGHGIRMHLCKKLIEFHGGKIKVSSNKKNSNSFTFNIPIIKLNEKPQRTFLKYLQPIR